MTKKKKKKKKKEKKRNRSGAAKSFHENFQFLFFFFLSLLAFSLFKEEQANRGTRVNIEIFWRWKLSRIEAKSSLDVISASIGNLDLIRLR